MEHNDDMKWREELQAGSDYLRSFGIPVDNEKELAEWIESYRATVGIPEQEIRSIMQRIHQNVIRQVEQERESGEKAVEEQTAVFKPDLGDLRLAAASSQGQSNQGQAEADEPAAMLDVGAGRLLPVWFEGPEVLIGDLVETEASKIEIGENAYRLESHKSGKLKAVGLKINRVKTLRSKFGGKAIPATIRAS